MFRKFVVLFIIVVIFEGAFRKWVLPEYGTEVFLLKDVILALAFAAYVVMHRDNVAPPSDMPLWILWIALVLTYSVVSGLSIQSLIGMRYYLAPLPLLLLIPALIRSPDDLDKVAVWAVRLSIPIGMLATLQYYSPIDSPINTYAWGADAGIASFGAASDDIGAGLVRARVTATFSYISTYAAFLGAVWILAWLSLLHSRSGFDRWLAGVGLVFCLVNMGMNGSRALLVLAVLTGLPFAIALFLQSDLLRSHVFITVFTVGIGLSLFTVIVLEPFELTLERGTEGEGSGRMVGLLLSPMATLTSIDLLGEGPGSTFGGYEQLGMQLGKEWDEINIDRVGIELGVVGYLVALFIKGWLLIKSVVVYRRLPTRHLRHWCLVALFLQLNPPWQIPFYNSIAAILYFSAIGLVYWLDEETKRQRRNAPSAANRPEQAYGVPVWRQR